MSTLALFPAEIAVGVDSTDAQCTPLGLAIELGMFGIDVCSNPRSHIRSIRSFMLERGEDGLAEEWTLAPGGPPASVFSNFPYSFPDPWCERLRDHHGPWVALPKFDSTTKWWRSLMAARSWWAPFRMRLPFERDGNSGVANFVSALVWKDWDPPSAVLNWLWKPRREI